MTTNMSQKPGKFIPHASSRTRYHELFDYHTAGEIARLQRCRRHALQIAIEARAAADALAKYSDTGDEAHINTSAVHLDYIDHLQLKIVGAA